MHRLGVTVQLSSAGLSPWIAPNPNYQPASCVKNPAGTQDAVLALS